MSLSIAQDNNVASIAQLWLAQAYNLTSLNPVTFVAGKDWELVDFLEESGQLADESAEGDNGIQYTYNLNFAFNKKRPELLSSFAPYLGTTAIAKVTDYNGMTQIVGNLQSPITFKQNNDTGKKFGDVNGVVITGVVVQDRPAIVL